MRLWTLQQCRGNLTQHLAAGEDRGSRSRPTPPGFGQIFLCRPDAWVRVSFAHTRVSIVGWIYDPDHSLPPGMYADVLDCMLVAVPTALEGLDHLMQRSPPSLLTTAACSGLRPEPDCRRRRTYLHLSYSYVSPFGPAILVTHDPKRSFARLRLRRQLRQIPFCAVRSQIAQLFVLHNLNLWSGSQWLPAASREVVVLRVLSADIFMSF